MKYQVPSLAGFDDVDADDFAYDGLRGFVDDILASGGQQIRTQAEAGLQAGGAALLDAGTKAAGDLLSKLPGGGGGGAPLTYAACIEQIMAATGASKALAERRFSRTKFNDAVAKGSDPVARGVSFVKAYQDMERKAAATNEEAKRTGGTVGPGGTIIPGGGSDGGAGGASATPWLAILGVAIAAGVAVKVLKG